MTGAVGGSVNMSCRQPEEYDHRTKMFCKMVRDNCLSLFEVSTQSEVKKHGKFTLMYESEERMLTLNIDKLTEDATAVYLCGVISYSSYSKLINPVQVFGM